VDLGTVENTESKNPGHSHPGREEVTSLVASSLYLFLKTGSKQVHLIKRKTMENTCKKHLQEIKKLRKDLELLNELKEIISNDCNVTLESILEERAVIYISSLEN
tara:strand:- start:87 stop:401 length:315 start_codon:yes stop_codon:yes gene_type:complete